MPGPQLRSAMTLFNNLRRNRCLERWAFVRTAPSTRVPVSQINRDLLRFWRAAESAAWEDLEPK